MWKLGMDIFVIPGVSISALRSALACSLRELRASCLCSGDEREVHARVTSEVRSVHFCPQICSSMLPL